ncbi:MAG: hydrogenase iron-sulfur subunit [Anaerolineales bacterium]|jgi:F420-non-reducing hydrogenase iron-sulfur subunit
MAETNFQPKIVAFLCNWCSYRAADLAGTSRMKYPANVRMVRVMCSGRVDPAFVLRAISKGADGVMIAGCHPGECHYQEQNYKTMRRFEMLKQTLLGFGMDEKRIRLQWASAAEGGVLAQAIRDMVEDIQALGPMDWSHNWAPDPEAEEAILALAEEHAEAMEVAR